MNADAFRTPAGTPVTAVSAEEMRAVDRFATEEVGLDLLQLMENAGRALAATVRETSPRRVVVLAGPGGNGGGGLAAARHLHNRGVDVRVGLVRKSLDGAPERQRAILDATGVPVEPDLRALAVDPEATVVDALVGYSLEGPLRGDAATCVADLAGHEAPVVSLDVPSGLDATDGDRPGASVSPDRVLTLALPKTGLADLEAPLELADIALPRTVYDRLDIPYENPFDTYRVRLTGTE